MKYIVNYGYKNSFESNSRNARQHARNLGESVIIRDKSGKFVCGAHYEWDCGNVTIAVFTHIDE